MLRRTLAALAVGTSVLLVHVDVEAAHRYRYRGHRWGYPAFHFGYAAGYYPSFGIGFGHYPVSFGFSYVGGPKDPRGSARFRVRPNHTEVYVDGYYAGVVDDFDGSFQKIRLDPGPHEITLYLDGHQVFQETIYSSLGGDVKIHHDMVPLAPGEPVPPRPAVPGGPARPAPSPPPGSAAPAPTGAAASPGPSSYGVLALRTQPSDVEVWIDGEMWHVPPQGERLMLNLPAGRYRIELKKEDYDTFATTIDVFRDETTALNVHLGAKKLSP